MAKKKFRFVVYAFIVGILLIAFATSPGYDQFIKFYEEQRSASAMAPVIGFKNGYIYTQFEVSYMQSAVLPGTDSTASKTVALPVQKEKWLGLFGRFWKMK